ncbi:SIMPL domain-containing protein [Nonlabens ponticola]|uniref:SIMPL domain-containing protein n=1 Tax=Nonlabens ponticola TaxID=2496866 RepID=A0A3S9MXG5_9FLAO|nr:SIMPL domain-containing protein [Nonlabens ponticola]AZQ43945.1 SIMPL domain-containing protein [Nonlabens ponticola]
MKNTISAIIFGIAIVLASIFLGKAYVDRSRADGTIEVTGLGSKDFTSDLIVWEGRYTSTSKVLSEAYDQLSRNKEIVSTYLKSKGIADSILVFSAVQTRRQTTPIYGDNGKYQGERFEGYELSQSVNVESSNVEQVEKISREVTELLNQGVQFYSQSPRYYYTKLADLKIEMISRATEDARIRAEKIAENSGGSLGDLGSARMGVFQITGQNSAEDYSWGGTYNTSSKEKTASITMKLVYESE